MSGLSITLVINSFSVMLIVVGMWSLLQLFGEYGVRGIMLRLKRKVKALESKLVWIKIQVLEFTLVYAKGLPMEERQLSITKYIAWIAPQAEWTCLNTDECLKTNASQSGCEGLLRDAFGYWIHGFSYNRDSYRVIEA